MTSTSTLTDFLTGLNTNAAALANLTLHKDSKPLELFTEDGAASFFLKEKSEFLDQLSSAKSLGPGIKKELAELCQLLEDVKKDTVLDYASSYLNVNILLNRHANEIKGLSERLIQILMLN